MLKIGGLLLVVVGIVAALAFLIWWVDRLFPSRALMIERQMEEAAREAEEEHERDMRFALWGACNQIEMQKIIARSRRKKHV